MNGISVSTVGDGTASAVVTAADAAQRPSPFAGPDRVAVVLAVAIYVLLLRVCYTAIIVPRYGYLGYWFYPPPVLLEGALAVVALAPALRLPLGVVRPSQFVLWFLYAVGYVPGILMPLYIGALPTPELLVFEGVFVACFLALMVAGDLPRARIRHLRIPAPIFWFGVLMMAATAVLAIRFVFGTDLSLPSAAEVYQRRAELKETVSANGAGVLYLSLWLANVIDPLLMAAALVNRRWILGVIGLASQILVFSVSGFKSVLLTPLLLVAVVWLLQNEGRRFGVRMAAGLVGTLVAGLALDPFLPSNPIIGALVRRLIVTPGVLTGVYVQYYSHHPHTLLGYSFLRSFVQDPGIAPPPATIGNYLAPGQGTMANTHFLADAFANFGLGGMVVSTIVVAAILWTYDSVTRDARLSIAVLLIAASAFELTNTSLQTVFVTHGLALALVIAALLPAQRMER